MKFNLSHKILSNSNPLKLGTFIVSKSGRIKFSLNENVETLPECYLLGLKSAVKSMVKTFDRKFCFSWDENTGFAIEPSHLDERDWF